MYTTYKQRKERRQRETGKRYEYFVAQTLRKDGWEVYENGRNGVNDHGIDLIASKDGVRRYIQCKSMKPEWLIHEDVVSHLFGSVAAIEGMDNLAGVELYIYSPAQFDNYASEEAKNLNIHLVQLNYQNWYGKHSHYRHYKKWKKHHYSS